MTAIEHIQAAQRAASNEAGNAVAVKLLLPFNDKQVADLQESLGLPLPEELRTILSFCSGIDGCLGGIDFTGDCMMFECQEIFPSGLPIAGDGLGNFWVLDLTPATTTVAPVYFAGHDAPVILYQSPDLASFLSEVFRLLTPPHKSLINDVQYDKVFDVWRKNPGVMDQPTAAAASDAVLRSFAAGLPPHFQIVDLRNVPPGMGFSWGRYGPQTAVRRHGYERVFGYAKPPPHTGLFAKLFGR